MISRRTRCLLLISLCFLWTSAGYLSWLYRLLELLDGQGAELTAEVLGYLLQAAGLGLAALCVRRGGRMAGRAAFSAVIGLDAVFTALSLLLPGQQSVLVCGGGMNLLHGVIAGFYLDRLSHAADWEHRARTFGLAYSAATLVCWLLGRFGGGSFLASRGAVGVYAALALLTVLLLRIENPTTPDNSESRDDAPRGRLIALAAAAVMLLSLVKGMGFSFPSKELRQGIDLELSRVFYAVGLVAAGFLSDRERRYGAVCCAAALCVPFVTISLAGQLGPSIAFWIISYLLQGFFTVFRVILFCDIAQKDARLRPVAGFGLLFGRVGDALGALASIALISHPAALMVLTAALFVPAMLIFFLLYRQLYTPPPLPAKSEQQQFYDFAARYDLSSREQEVLRLILEGRSTQEMAGLLYVTESTIKFHIHNLLKKTKCAHRVALVAHYQQTQ